MPDRAALIEKLTGFRKGDASMDYERIDGPTPSGGDYSEIYYCDDNNNRVDSEYATRFHIRECKADGSLVFETHGLIHR